MEDVKKDLKCLIVVYSYHHMNTAKIADVMAGVLNADVKTPDQVSNHEFGQYDLIGFGGGIDSGRHYKPILDFVDQLPKVDGKQSFIFSTSAVMGEKKVRKDHTCLRDKLLSKGFYVLDEFSCKGFNTNLFLKYLGGMNKGRPNSDDFEQAEVFAKGLLKKI